MQSDPDWPHVFAQLAAGLVPALGALAVAVEHVGSTAVPGLPAKPIVDIAVGLIASPDTQATTAAVIAALGPLGYQFRGDKGGDGGLLFLLESRPAVRIAHVHGVLYGGFQWRRYLAVRDRLRKDPAARQAYADLKRTLARRYADNRVAYTEAKSSFVGWLVAGSGVR